jgi:hypothetical protein
MTPNDTDSQSTASHQPATTSNDSDDYDGTLTVSAGQIDLPERYAAAEKFVARHTTLTMDAKSGAPVDFVPWPGHEEQPEDPHNPDLAIDELALHEYGGDHELYRVVDADADASNEGGVDDE